MSEACPNLNQYDQLKRFTTVVADTGNLDDIRRFRPQDATTNPTLVLKTLEDPAYQPILDQAIKEARRLILSEDQKQALMLDLCIVLLGKHILHLIPGRVSTEIDARLSFDTEATIERAKNVIRLYEMFGISRERVLIKIASTWEGILAASQLEKEGIHCNLTLLFSLPQAIACAEAGVTLISPFVGRILDWHQMHAKAQPISHEDDPGVQFVKSVYQYYKSFHYSTEIMGASFRHIGQIQALAGCDLLTISPKLLQELQTTFAPLKRHLFAGDMSQMSSKQPPINEKTFRFLLNEDAMATEKLAEGMRLFVRDTIKMEQLVLAHAHQI